MSYFIYYSVGVVKMDHEDDLVEFNTLEEVKEFINSRVIQYPCKYHHNSFTVIQGEEVSV